MIRQERCKITWENGKGKQSHGGLLYLTDHRLIFEAETGGLRSRKLVTEFEQPLEDIRNVSLISSLLGGTRGFSIESSLGVRDFLGISQPQLWQDSTLEKIHARREHIEDMLRRQEEARRIEDERTYAHELELKRATARKEIVKEVREEVVMVPCRYCAGLIPDTSVFCSNCGARRSSR
jgi:hypothetical protein